MDQAGGFAFDERLDSLWRRVPHTEACPPGGDDPVHVPSAHPGHDYLLNEGDLVGYDGVLETCKAVRA